MSKDPLPKSLEKYEKLELQFQKSSQRSSKGSSSLLARQLILHQYSPKVSVISSELADLVSQEYGYDRFVQLLQGIEDNLFGESSCLSNKVHCKFVKPIDETIRFQLELKNDRRSSSNSELFDLDTLKPDGKSDLNYLRLMENVSSSLTILPFETFNHPIIQLFTISLEESLQKVKSLLNDWKYIKYPKWIDIDDMLVIFMIVVDSKNSESLQMAHKLKENLKIQLNYRSMIVVRPEEDVDQKFLKNVNEKVIELINKYLLVYMEKKTQHWTETIVNPRKSFTGRFLSVGKKWGTSSDNLANQQSYNSAENYYYSKSNEFLIRKLGDWYFMLRDYKRSYTTYELLKKDFLNEKLWNYLASLQEFMIISLLVGSSQKVSMIGNGVTGKIIDDLIIPMIDSLQYSYLSRCNLRSYSLRSLLTIGELFITLGESNQQIKINNNNARYFDESYQLFNRVIDLNLVDERNKAMIMFRISYIYSIYYIDLRTRKTPETLPEQPNKTPFLRDDLEIMGLTRHRKSALWTHLATTQLELN